MPLSDINLASKSVEDSVAFASTKDLHGIARQQGSGFHIRVPFHQIIPTCQLQQTVGTEIDEILYSHTTCNGVACPSLVLQTLKLQTGNLIWERDYRMT